MSTPSSLNHFIESVPVCVQSGPLEVVRSIFSRGNFDRVVVVNQQGYPVGLVYLHRLIPYLLPHGLEVKESRVSSVIGRPDYCTETGAKAQPTETPLYHNPGDGFPYPAIYYPNSRYPPTPEGEKLTAEKTRGKSSVDPLMESLYGMPPTSLPSRQTTQPYSWNWHQPLSEVDVVDSLKVVPGDWSLPQFWQSLQQREGWNSPGQMTQGGLPIALVDSSGKFVGLLDQVRLLKFMAETGNWESPSLPSPLPHVPLPLPTEAFSPASGVPNLLLEVLESLPIPLSLQAQDGGVLSQNAAWRSQIGTAPDQHPPTKETVAQFYQNHLPLLNSPNSSWCQVGTQPNTYVCVCPLPGGNERVWQFVKQPLDFRGPILELWLGDIDPTLKLTFPQEDGIEANSHTSSPQLMLVLAQDVTEQYLVAQELAAKNADLIQLNRLKDEFLACISHELKTPLTAVLGLSSLLKNQTLGELNEQQARYAKLIHQSGRHLMTVVNDILDLTSMETGQLELVLDPVQIRPICERAFEQAQRLQPSEKSGKNADNNPQDSSTNIPFTLQIESGLEMMVADELRLRQMLVHLLSNALKFTTPEGQIGLNINRWEGWIAFTVWDTGIGIPADKQHLIFQKFQQLESPLTRRFEGTGLGLVLTQRLARLHGGDITFVSKEGEGSEFTLLLPPCPPQPRRGEADEQYPIRTPQHPSYPVSIPPTASSLPRAKPLTLGLYPPSRLVLIVEAMPRFIEDLSEQLMGSGYRVVIARSGTEALEKARRLQPRVIFLNPLLPLLSGWDVLTLLKSDAETAQIPVIVMATRGEKKQASIHRADGFLSLPVQKPALEEILTNFSSLLESEALANHQPLTILLLSPLKSVFQAADSGNAAPFIPLDKMPAVTDTEKRDVKLEWEQQVSPVSSHPSPSGLDSSHTLAQLACSLLRSACLGRTVPDLLPNAEQLGLPENYIEPSLLKILALFRVIEADDLDQAAMITRIWQPHVILLENTGESQSPEDLVRQLSQHEALAALPLVTLDAETTQAANQVKELSVFPCLVATHEDDAAQVDPQSVLSALLQVVQVAAGMKWKPSILVVDLSSLPDLRFDLEDSKEPENTPFTQALIQYIETAGFQGVMGRSWGEVLQQLQYKSVDLLLIYWHESAPLALVQPLLTLQHLETKPPILVLDHSDSNGEHLQTPKWGELTMLLQKMDVTILPSSLSMAELLEQMKQALKYQG